MNQPASPEPLSVLLVCADPVDRARWQQALAAHHVQTIDVSELLHVERLDAADVLVLAGISSSAIQWLRSLTVPIICIAADCFSPAADVVLPPTVADSEFRTCVELLGAQTRLLRKLDDTAELIARASARFGWRAGRPRRSPSELVKLAITDPLTGVHNRRHIDEQLPIEFQWAQSSGGSLSLALIDLDNLKALNDGHGLPFGDRALQHAAASLQRSLRADDLLCRYGGDEFIVLAPGCSAESARVLAERLRAAVSASPVPHDNEAIRLTCSIGVATATSSDPPTAHELFRRADESLSAAKRGGRNSVVHWLDLQ